MFSGIKVGNVVFSIVFWTFVLNFYVVTRYAGVVENGITVMTIGLMTQVTITGAIIGVILGFVGQIRLFKKGKRKSYALTILKNTIGHLLFFSITVFLSSLYGNSLEFAKNFFVSTESLVALAFLSLSSLIFHFVSQMGKMFGRGVLMEYLTGKYYNPIEEERIFMFLDLKSSTKIAENLEHKLYSNLIQDCFEIASLMAESFMGRIYQYVGDEVVITWKVSSKLNPCRAVDFFFQFKRSLEDRADYFNEVYGLVPEFKASLHGGKVMAAEVGRAKSEIAYHGDVLNAALEYKVCAMTLTKRYLFRRAC